jgi:hypothetical protein
MLRRLASLGLALAALTVGCGTGISLDPASADPPHTETGDDGGQIQAIDAGEDHAPADARARDVDDAALRGDGHDGADADAGGARDRAADGDMFDGTGDVFRDAADDPQSDLSLDAARDSSVDVFNDSTGDATFDAFLDVLNDRTSDSHGDGGDVRRDAADVSDGPKDATQDNARDADAADAFDGCTVTCWPDADYYVDATAPPGGNGSKLQPFNTITAAVQAHGASPGIARKAYVAPGRYDEALGERFPLVLRGLSLLGAGQDRTLIVGAGRFDHAEGGSIPPNLYTVTIVVGERQLPTDLSGLSVRSSSPVPVENYYGVFCDRGNASGEVASPLGQTHLDQVTVGPGYGVDVAVGTSIYPSSTGCNMLITRSTITAARWGVFALGCGSNDYDDPVMLEMGTDDPSSGNTVSWMNAANDLAAGVKLQDCVIHGSFQYNTFRDSLVGVSITDSGTVSPPHTRVNVTFKHNIFERLTNYGLLANGYTLFASEISDNRFSSVSKEVNRPGFEAIALSMDAFNVAKVRRNEFIGNDTAVRVGFSTSTGVPADFGTGADPGNNVFRCNSARDATGGDVLIAGDVSDPELTWAGTLRFAGNAWDHTPPTFLTVDPPPNGVDISLLYAPHIDIDRQNATLSTAVCPSGRAPGQ